MLLKNPQTRFEEIYRIYKESFPDIERRTKDDQKRVFGNPCYKVRVIEEDEKIVAFLGYWDLPTCVLWSIWPQRKYAGERDMENSWWKRLWKSQKSLCFWK